VTADQIFVLITIIVAALLGIGALVAVLRGRSDQAAAPTARERGQPQIDKYEPNGATTGAAAGASYDTAVRVLWWISTAAVMVGVGLSDAYRESQPAIYLVGAGAVAVVVLLHDLLPARFRTPAVGGLEVLAAIGLTTVLLTLTGFGGSPFVYAYHLVAVAVALAMGGAIALGAAALATLAYAAVLGFDPAIRTYGGDEILRFGLNIGSLWLLAYLAGVFASGERRMRATVLELSRTDTLTSLFNRAQLFPTLEQEVQRTRRSERGFCLLMIDLDGLKAVNDSYGHHRGDEVLHSLAGVIRRSIRLVDTAYRYGGDEFLVLLPETDFAGAFVVAEKIRSGAEEVGLKAGGGELLTSVSIGLVSCPEDGTSTEELMIAVDRAMYQAKSLGKNQISGNPRPRRLATRAGLEEVAAEAAPSPVEEPRPAAASATTATTATPFTVDSAAPSVISPRVPAASALRAASAAPATSAASATAVAAGGGRTGGNSHEATDEEEPDPGEVRKQIAAARLNMDPDHQIRRAMDAFLSSPRSTPEPD
jgi:diguanylate cyclase (GGDEF)-like protein